MSNTPTRERQLLAGLLKSGIIHAWVEGKAIQARKCEEATVMCCGEPALYLLGRAIEDWYDITDPNWTAYPVEWRVKPTPTPPPTVVNWITGEPPRVAGVKYLHPHRGNVETISWCGELEGFTDPSGGMCPVEFWAPMCNLPGDK